jgi:hypothetical protein
MENTDTTIFILFSSKKYKATQAIFGHCPLSLISQSTIKLAHEALY